ncbi:MAG: hypothetical protein PHV97_07060, partial [Candidatus Omnitrophica bacterium]|nr:hypothetical protein [Candidatus Omnitrophota bacterium]
DGHEQSQLIAFADQDELLFKPIEAYGIRVGAVIGPTSVIYPQITPAVSWERQLPVLIRELEGNVLATFLARPSDVPKMIEAEQITWDKERAAPPVTIEGRVKANPEGALVCLDLKTKRLLGFFSAIRITDQELSHPLRWEECAKKSLLCFQARNSEKQSPFSLMGVSLTVVSDAPRGTGRLLMESAVRHASNLVASTLEYVVRIPNFRSWQQATSGTIHEYIQFLRSGKITEPTTQIATRSGAIWGNVIPDYYDDPDSMNYGIHFIHIISASSGDGVQA